MSELAITELPLPRREIEHHKATKTTVGKDILELLSISMYVDPLDMYREYVQNSADAIDDACALGLLEDKSDGVIEIKLSLKDRFITVRDNGAGILAVDFERLMVSFGASPKRGNAARGFRGVGRLSGLAFCQELIFRAKGRSEKVVSEISWDGRKFRKMLQDNQNAIGLEELVSKVATITTYEAKNRNEHFFEVELRKVIRTKNDVLLSEGHIESYLAQSCPVPYSEKFSLKAVLETFLSEYNVHPGYKLILSCDFGDPAQIFRPYLDDFSISATAADRISGVQTFCLAGVNEGFAAIGWVFIHSYKGVIWPSANLRGIRVRLGNIQIGDDALLVDVFPESRFNSWSMGEIHVLDPKVIPNGRRDNFEQNIHWAGIQSQFGPYAKKIAGTCRRNSAERNIIKRFDGLEERALLSIELLRQEALTAQRLEETKKSLAVLFQSMKEICEKDTLSSENAMELNKRYKKIDEELASATSLSIKGPHLLDSVPKSKRIAYQEIFDLIYLCSSNKANAKGLLDKIILALATR